METTAVPTTVLTDKQKAINTTIDGLSAVLGAIHAGATIIATAAVSAEVSLKSKHYTKADGPRLTATDINNIIAKRMAATQRIQVKIKQLPASVLESAFDDDAQD